MRTILAVTALATACAPEVPDEPTWIDDVRPILVANCVRCHSAPPIGGAPDYFRLDAYDDERVPDGPDPNDTPDVVVSGAATSAAAVAIYTEQGLMPPRFPLTDRQIDVLAAWDAAGAPRGERPDNAAPTLELEAAPEVDEDGRVVLRYEIDDADGDLVVGWVRAEPAADGIEPVRISNQLLSGRGRVGWNTASAAPGVYMLVAELDDGVETVNVDLGDVEVQP